VTSRISVFLLGVLFMAARAAPARADGPVQAPVAPDDAGLVVVGLGSSMDLAWPLARAVYADATLRPPRLDEPHARVLAGENAPPDALAELRDLAESRAAIRGDDAASRRLLDSIAASIHVKGIVVVTAPTQATARPTARVFLTPRGAAGSFEAAVYEADPSAPVTWGAGAPAVTWDGAVQALRRGFGQALVPSVSVVASTPAPAPDLALHPIAPAAAVDQGTKSSRPFYRSPWFWAAAAGAAFAATAIYFATRNDGSDNIQLQVRVPK